MRQKDGGRTDRQRERGREDRRPARSSAGQLSPLSLPSESRSYLAMSSGLRRKWRRAVRALGILRGTGGDGGGAVSLLLFLVSPPSRG